MLSRRMPRGPLRALHTNHVDTQGVELNRNDSGCSTPSRDEKLYTSYTSSITDDAPTTPMIRVNSSNNFCRRTSLQPLRTSSYRENKSHNLTTVEDIRCHFPIRLSSAKSLPTNGDSKSSADSGVPKSPLRCQKRPGENDGEEVIEPKHSRYSQKDSDVSFPEHKLTMGAFVKAHPRYFRRRSGTDYVNQSDDEAQHFASKTTVNQRLSPICPVPMPEGFPLQLPMSCATVCLPWETRQARLTQKMQQRTTETQTSPTEIPSPVSVQKRSRPKRQSFGSSQMLVGLRKTFGNLRRAISAERLQRSQQSGQSAKPTPPTASKSKRRSLVLRHSSIRRSSANFVASSNVNAITVPEQPVQNEIKPAVPSQPGTKLNETNKLTCHVIGKSLDGSIRVALRRGSTQQQFGFFIARDSDGIYISRLGSVRSAVKYWDVFRVGDRILEVQGISCNNLDVEDIQNLTRGCELVEFRMKPAHSNLWASG